MNPLLIIVLNTSSLSILYCLGKTIWHLFEHYKYPERYQRSSVRVLTKDLIATVILAALQTLLTYSITYYGGTSHFSRITIVLQALALIVAVLIFHLLEMTNYTKTSWRKLYPEDEDGNSNRLGWVTAMIIGCITVLCVFGVSMGDVFNTINAANSVPITKTVHKAQTMPLPDSDNHKIERAVNSQKTVNDQVNMSLNQMQNKHANLNSYQIDQTQVQIYHGKLVYVTSLDYAKHFSKIRGWYKIPGYFITDATHKDAKPHFVKKTMYYANSGYFAQNVNRRLSFIAAQNNVMLADPTYLEIAEDGTPYYVNTGYYLMNGGSLPKFNGYKVLTVNAINGKTACYDQKQAPKWLDNVVSPDLLEYAVKQYTEYHNGIINREFPWGSRSGVNYLVHNVGYLAQDDDELDDDDTNSFSPVLYQGKMYYFGTLTSLNNEQNSVTGYVYANTRTGKITISSETANAMTPQRAKQLAVNKLRQTKWQATMPLLYLIDKKPTWVVSMVDSQNVFQKYVYIKADGNGLNNTIAIGDNADEALLNYRILFTGETTTAKNESSRKIIKTGTVERVNRYNEDNVRFTFKGQKIVYNISVKRDANSIFLEPNDKIKVIGFLNSNNTVIVTKITNLPQ